MNSLLVAMFNRIISYLKHICEKFSPFTTFITLSDPYAVSDLRKVLFTFVFY